MTSFEIIRKWYGKLGFDNRYDEEFAELMKSDVSASAFSKIDEYDFECCDGVANLFFVLYACEELFSRYSEAGIGEDIFIDTMSDIPVAVDSWYEITGKLWLGNLNWLSNHFKFRIFKLGRLQFGFGRSRYDVQSAGLTKGDDILEVHIQAGGNLLVSECCDSFKRAILFFEKHFPEYSYGFFTCYSWLLGQELEEILGDESNILKFGKMFDIHFQDESDRILNYVFHRGARAHEIAELEPKNAFATRVKESFLSGMKFYEGFGIIEKSRFLKQFGILFVQ